jgi:type I site-specific restriction endonuclease
MNEAETRAELIDPALKAAGWGVVEASRVRREVITLGRLQGAGVRAAKDIADYVLTYRNHKLAVIEAKRRDLPDTEGVGQAKKYAENLQTRFAYSTNGDGIDQVDMTTGAEQYVTQSSWLTATSSPTRPTTRSPPSRKMHSCGSTPRSSARRAACRRTATSSSPSSRPS